LFYLKHICLKNKFSEKKVSSNKNVIIITSTLTLHENKYLQKKYLEMACTDNMNKNASVFYKEIIGLSPPPLARKEGVSRERSNKNNHSNK
jgi:hypothetical protein